jgi:hypothetical protein
MPLLPKIGL